MKKVKLGNAKHKDICLFFQIAHPCRVPTTTSIRNKNLDQHDFSFAYQLTVFIDKSDNNPGLASFTNTFFNCNGVNVVGFSGTEATTVSLNTRLKNPGKGRYEEINGGRAWCAKA